MFNSKQCSPFIFVVITFWLVAYCGFASAQTAAQDCQKLGGNKGIAACDRAIKLNPRDAIAFYNRGFVWLLKDEEDRAISDFNEAIRLNPQLARAFSSRGLAWEGKGDLVKALSDYRSFVSIDPKDPDGPKNIARVSAAMRSQQSLSSQSQPQKQGIVTTQQPSLPVANNAGAQGCQGSARNMGQRCHPDDIATELPRFNVDAICREAGIRNGSSAVGRCFDKQQAAYNDLKRYLGKVTLGLLEVCTGTAMAEKPDISDMGYLSYLKCVRGIFHETEKERSRQAPIDRKMQEFKFKY